ncbi:MAG: PIN domain-containing protein [Euryarchaeota archaeon]|nr:PIN domain-containing protein [Euryarchaeota archaeon]
MIAIDTSVWVEYINTGGVFHPQAKAVIDSLGKGGTEAILTPITLAEIYYVSERVYKEAYTAQESEALAKKFYDFVYYHPHVEIKELDYELCLKAAMIKSRYKIAISDCFLFALSEKEKVAILFRGKEKEMEPNMKELKNRFNLKFLEDYT